MKQTCLGVLGFMPAIVGSESSIWYTLAGLPDAQDGLFRLERQRGRKRKELVS